MHVPSPNGHISWTSAHHVIMSFVIDHYYPSVVYRPLLPFSASSHLPNYYPSVALFNHLPYFAQVPRPDGITASPIHGDDCNARCGTVALIPPTHISHHVTHITSAFLTFCLPSTSGLSSATAAVARLIGARPVDVFPVVNATAACNAVIGSVLLAPPGGNKQPFVRTVKFGQG